MSIRKFVVAMAILILPANVGWSKALAQAAEGVPRTAHLSKTTTAHVIPDAGILDAADLVAIAKLAVATSKDKFSDDPTLKYVGRDFSFMPDVAELITDYDKQTQTLTVSTVTFLDAFTLDRQVTESQYIGQNSFGASAKVEKRRGDVYGIENPGNSYSRKAISFKAELDGTEARGLSHALRLKLYGTIKQASGVYAAKNSLLVEKPLIEEATVADPTDTFIEQHLIAVDFTKAEWVDSRTGSIVKSEEFLAAEPSSTGSLPIQRTHTLPPYPTISQRLGEQGTSQLALSINTEGSVSDCKVAKSSGSERLDTAACEYVKSHWKWDPPSTQSVTTIVSIPWSLKTAQ